MCLMRLTYFSTLNFDPVKNNFLGQLTDIVNAANSNNCKNEITGALIADTNWFVQILEGERDAVWSTFKRIEKDDRHSGVTPIEMVVAPDRYFGNWWMTFTERSAANTSQFAPFLVHDVFDPSKMLPDQILSLMINLTCQNPERELGIAGIGIAAQLIRDRAKRNLKSAASR